MKQTRCHEMDTVALDFFFIFFHANWYYIVNFVGSMLEFWMSGMNI
jgi:hypothetical protein